MMQSLNPPTTTSSETLLKRKTIPPHLKGNQFYSDVWQRVHRYGGDAKICITAFSKPGESVTRKGKSSLAVKQGTYFDINYKGKYRFNSENVIASLSDLRGFLDEPRPRGTVLMLEEIQNWLNVRTSLSKENFDAIKKFSTSGYLGYIYLATAPRLEDVDKQIRQYFPWECRIFRRDDKNKLIHWMPFKCAHPPNSVHPIRRIAYRYQDGVINRTLKLKSTLPPQNIMDAYEEKIYSYKQDWQKAGINARKVGASGEEKQQKYYETLKGRTRQRHLLEIEANNLWDVRNVSQLAKRLRCSREKAAAMFELIVERANETVLDRVNEDEQENVLARS